MPLKKILSALRRALPIVGVGLMVVVLGTVLGVSFYLRGRAIMEWELKDKLRTTAAMAALQFDASVIDAIDNPNDERTPGYQNTVARLRAIRDTGPNIRYAYLMRRTEDPNILSFVADADALSTEAELDRNGNGIVDPEEEPSFIGDAYDATDVPAMREEAFLHPAVDEEITVDQWGELISGYAPIKRSDGTTAVVLGIDMTADEYRTLSHSIFSPVALLLLLLAVTAIGGFSVLIIWRRRQEMLEKIADERTGLMRLTFHQLGSPLTILKWAEEQLKESHEAGRILKELPEFFASLDDATARLDAILRALKNADSIAENALVYTPQRCAMSSIIDDAIRGLKPRLEQRKHVLSIEGEATVHVAADCGMVTAVLHELLDNAMNYSERGSPIVIRTHKDASKVSITVIDRGIGIPAHDIHLLSERFVRGSNATKMHPDGSGLGLYIARGIIERAGGTFEIRSREGQGTTVSFTLPLA